MSGHANLSPSKRHRWAACPGSIREEARYPASSSGPSAIDGTHSHTLLEHCIKNRLLDPTRLIGQTLSDHDGSFTVDTDRANRVKVAVDYIRSRLTNPQYEVMAEERVDPKWLTGRDDLHGTVDVQLWLGDVYEIIDYKDGMGVVTAEGNPQLEQYAVGVLSKFKLAMFEPYPFDTVRMTIIQPKLAMKGMPAITSHDVPVIELLIVAETLKTQAAYTDDPNAPLIPGDKQCKFCQHKGACSALAGSVMQEVGLMFQPVTVTSPATDLAQQSADKDPSQMSDDQLRQALEAAPLLRQFIEGIEAEALRRLQAGQTVPGFKLVRGRGTRSWTLPDEQMAEKLTGMGIPKGDVFTSKIVSPAQVEKLRWKNRKGEEKQLTERQIKTLATDYIGSSHGKMTVAPESDSREAVVMNAAPLFTQVEASVVTPEPALPAWLM